MIHVLLDIAGMILLLFICVLLADWFALGRFRVMRSGEPGPEPQGGNADPVRAISARNYVEQQKGESCGGYAAAYVLRHFGGTETGEEVYSGMSKFWKGRVWVKEVRKQLRIRGLETEYRRGDAEVLRRELDSGDPVILLLNTTGSSLTLHFAVAAGYGEGVFFLADSARPAHNFDPRLRHRACERSLPEGTRINGPFNRIVSEEELMELWDTSSIFMPFHKYTYVKVISQRPGQRAWRKYPL